MLSVFSWGVSRPTAGPFIRCGLALALTMGIDHAALGEGEVADGGAAGGAWVRADEVRAIVSELLADAESRSSLLESGATAGHDGRFFLASEDGNFRLNIGGQIQFRYNLNFRNKDGVVNDEDFESGFNQPRTRVHFAGNTEEPGLF